MTNKKITVQNNQPFEPMLMIQAAVEKGIETNVLKELMDLQERYEANNARKSYNKAMAEFSANAPRITKDSQVGFDSKKGGSVQYKYASLANIVNIVSPCLSAVGLSHSWRTTQEGNQIIVKCVISHVDGHSESTQLQSAADNSGSKNSIQAIGSTVSFLKRYTFESMLGLSSFDDDGALAKSNEHVEKNNTEFVSEEQAKELDTLLEKTIPLRVNRSGWFTFIKKEYNATSNHNIPADCFENAMTRLENQRRKSTLTEEEQRLVEKTEVETVIDLNE